MITEATNLSEAKRKLLEKYLRGDLLYDEVDTHAITPRSRGESAPLSLAQEQLWLRSRMIAERPPVYNESVTIRRTGPLDFEALRRALNEMVRRHEAWRTTFDVIGESPVQIIHPAPVEFPLRIMDVSGMPEGERESEALRVATEEACAPFDLRRGPLARATLVRLADEEYRLYLTMHQIIVDGISVYDIIPSEISTLHQAFSEGMPSPLPELHFQFADFAVWQRSWLQGRSLANQVSYWRKQLSGNLPVLQWPTDRPRPTVQTFRGSIKPFTLPNGLTEDLRELSRREGVCLFATLLAGFTSLLYRYTGQDDNIVGTLAPTGRKRSEFQRLLGYFLNPVALRTDLSGDPTFRELLRQSHGLTLKALSHDDVPVEHLAQELKLTPDPSRHPFFQVMISLAPNMPELPSGWDMTPMDVESGGARWDLYLELNDRRNGMLGRAQYNPDLFDASKIEKLIEGLQELLEAATSNPDQHISDLQRLTLR